MHAERLALDELEVARCGPFDQGDDEKCSGHHEHDHPPGQLRDTERHGDDDQERDLPRDAPHGRRDAVARRRRHVAIRRRCRPRLLRPTARAQDAEVGPQRGRLAMERVDRLERPQCGVQLRGVAVERVERRAHALLLIALLGDRQVLDARQRLARRFLWSRPGLVAHGLRLSRPCATQVVAFTIPRTCGKRPHRQSPRGLSAAPPSRRLRS